MSVEIDLQTSWNESVNELQKKLLKPRDKDGSEPSTQERHPRMVLSVIGDSSSFVPQPWVTQVFQLGLIETAKGATDCLILYKGSKEKVSTLVWEAVDDFRVMDNQNDQDDTFIQLIGLGPKCDYCTEESQICDDCRKVLSEDTQPDDNVMETYYKLNIGDKADKEQKLESYGKYHAMLLSKIAEQYVPFVELKEDELTMKVPVLVIVAEGDMSTLDAVIEVLENGIPVLILKGSGKAADLIAECIDDIESVKAKAPLLFGIYFLEKDLNRLSRQMEKITEHIQFVNIFDITDQEETGFPDAVVNSIIRAWAQGGTEENERPIKSAIGRRYIKETPEEKRYSDLDFEDHEKLYKEAEYQVSPEIAFPNNELDVYTSNGSVMNGQLSSRKYKRSNSIGPLTVTLRNMKGGEVKEFMTQYEKSLKPASLRFYFYIAYQFIQEMDSSGDKTDRKKNFQILLQKAIIAGRVDYVTVLLREEGVEFDKTKFKEIYEVINCRCDTDGDCQHIRSILRGASSEATKDLIEKTKFRKQIQCGRQLCQKLLHYPQKSYDGKFEWEEENGSYQKKGIFHDLLIWALFANRRELAALFWANCENQLLTAILASCVLKNMAARARSGKDQFLYDSLKEHSRIFAQRALDMQTKLYEKDPEIAMELMLTEHAIWNIQVSPLECAFDNAMLDFIAHSCAQRRLNKIWYKKIGASLGDFWKDGFFCGCRRVKEKVPIGNGDEKEEKKVVLFKFVRAPLTRFLVHYIIFLAAMVCYSAFLLIELSAYEGVESIKVYEWIIYVWLFADMIEEYRGVVPWNHDIIRSKFSKEDQENQTDKRKDKATSQSKFYRFKRYMYDFWNALDFISYTICISAICVRFLYQETYARRLHSLGLFTIYMRFLHAILLSRKLGPKIIMIKEMLKDLFRFIGILFIFMMGVGVLYHANMYPAHFDMWNLNGWTYWRIWKIMYIPYWQIYGELFLDTFEANSTTPCTTNQSEWESNPEIERCNEFDWILIVIAAFYMLISNLLLVNLVIALFSYRFEIVQANSTRLWRYWRYAVIMDYRTRVPAPLNLILRPFMLIFKCVKACKAKNNKPDKRAIDRMERLQTISANKCIREENNSKE